MILRIPRPIGAGRQLVEGVTRAGFEERSTADGPEYVLPRAEPVLAEPMAVPGTTALVKQGWSSVCALCVHLRMALAAGSDVCGQDCGGPLSGQGFPAYRGPVPRAFLSTFCFVCGKLSVAGAMRPDWPAPLGICEAHVGVLERR